MRTGLVRIRSRLKCQVHATLAEHGITTPVTDLFGKQGRRLLAGLQLPEVSQRRIEACRRIIDDLNVEIEIAHTELLAMFETDSRTQRLLPIPGIGFTTAAVITPPEITALGQRVGRPRTSGHPELTSLDPFLGMSPSSADR